MVTGRRARGVEASFEDQPRGQAFERLFSSRVERTQELEDPWVLVETLVLAHRE